MQFNWKMKEVYLTSFDQQLLTEAKRNLQNLLEEYASVILTPDQYRYLKKKTEVLDQLKVDLGLKDIQAIKGPKPQIKIQGTSTRIGRAKEEINVKLQNLQTETISFKPESGVTFQDIRSVRDHIEKKRAVVIKVEQNEQVVVKITGPKESIPAAKTDLNKIEIKTVSWEPKEGAKQLSAAFKKVYKDEASFLQTWKLKSLEFNEKHIKIRAKSEDDIESAKQALLGILHQQKILSEEVSVSELHWGLISKEKKFRKKFEAIGTTCNVTISQPGKKLQKGMVSIRGPSHSVYQAKVQVVNLIREIQKQLKTIFMDLQPDLANEISKNNWALADQIFDSSHVRISIPDKETTRVLAELVTNTFKIEVVEGSILAEPTDCIVNSANEQLKHDGGVAKAIAEKAGSKLRQECEEYIDKNTKLQTGTCLHTTAGKLTFKGVIHTVGPKWKEGTTDHTLLAQAVTSALSCASEYGYQSISIPAISAGNFGYPKDKCATTIISSAIKYLGNNPGTMNLVRICDLNEDMLKEFTKTILGYNNYRVTKISDVKGLEVAYQWSWKENDGRFVAFDPDQNLQIEVAYQKQNRTGTFTVVGDMQKKKNNYSYEINFDNMTELNIYFRANPREIRREAKQITPVIWEVQVNEDFHALDETTVRCIELGFLNADKFPYVNVQWNGEQGRTKFESRQLEMENSGKLYAVRRRQRDFDQEMRQYLSDNNNNNSVGAKVKVSKVRIQLTGLDEDLPKGQQELEAALSKLKTKKKCVVGKLSQTQVKGAEDICLKYGVELQHEVDHLVLSGLEVSVANALTDILQSLYQQHFAVSYPSHWDANQQNVCELKLVVQGSEEWKSVDAQVRKTIPDVKLEKIERVQNTWLWEKYCISKNLLAKKNNGNVNELTLFHGTRDTDPAQIYNGEHAFDMRFCVSGMWGIAIYFAENASYSKNYASHFNGKKQMFLARVAVGECKHIMPNDNQLRKPPQKPNSTNGLYEDYDSVSGDTMGSRVYMIYENGRAYPEYLITFV